MLLANKEGIIQAGAVVNLAAAGAANAVAVFTLPALAGQLVGIKSLKLRSVHLFNNAAGNQEVLLGVGVGAGVAAMPGLNSMNNLADFYKVYRDFDEVEFFATIVAWPVALPAGSIDIQVEVTICG